MKPKDKKEQMTNNKTENQIKNRELGVPIIEIMMFEIGHKEPEKHLDYLNSILDKYLDRNNESKTE